MHGIMRVVVAVGIAMTCSVSWLASGVAAVDVYGDPILWDDLVVSGRVERIEYSTMPADAWYQVAEHDDMPVELVSITLLADEVMRGSIAGDEVILTFPRIRSARDEVVFNERVSVGVEVLATARYTVRGAPMWRMMNVYTRVEGGWSHYEYRIWSAPVADAEISERLASVDLHRAIEKADLIVRGTVVERSAVGAPGSEVLQYRVELATVVKGVASGDVTFRATRYVSTDGSGWRQFLALELEEGATYYLFLQRTDEGFAPACGPRSVLRVNGDQVLEMSGAPTKYRTESLEREVARFTEE